MRYRPNVCAVVRHPQGSQVLVCRRADHTLGAARWQFPQGGIHQGETPREALLRELEEEIGTRAVAILAQAPRVVRYEFPPEIAALLAAGDPGKQGFVGQEQTWFLVRLLVGEDALRLDGGSREFDAYRWVTAAEALVGVVHFTAAAYRAGLSGLGLLPEAPGGPG